VAVQRPRRQDQAWLRIWTDKTVLSSSPAPQQQQQQQQQQHHHHHHHQAGTITTTTTTSTSTELVSNERLAEESRARLQAMEAELDVLFESLTSNSAVPPPDAGSIEAVDEARREVVVEAWRRRTTQRSVLCWYVWMWMCMWAALLRRDLVTFTFPC
jgi:hypothetical protein